MPRPTALPCLLAATLLASLALTPTPAQAGGTTTVVVDGSNDDWAFLPETGTPTGYFSVGPAAPPAGDGSALLLTDDSADGIAIISQELVSTRLDDITSLSYWTYTDNAPQAPALQFSIDYDDTDADVGWQGRLVFEPANVGGVLADQWQQWNTLVGLWWSSGSPGNVTCPQSSPCTWNEVLTAFPNAAIHGPVLGQFLVKSGSGWSGTHTTYTDAIAVTTSTAVDVLYDFESTSATVNVSGLGVNGWFSDDTRADGTAAKGEAPGTDLVSPTLTADPEATADGTVAHDDDILNQIDFLFFGPPVAPPVDEHQGAVHLTIADAVNPAKSQISHRNNPDVTMDADGFGFGYEVLSAIFQAQYSWLGDGTGSVTASLKFGFQTQEYGATGVSSRTGENAWDKLLIYEPGNGNGATSDGTWHTENINFTSGSWWLFDREEGAGTIGTPMPLAAMFGSAVAVGGGGKTVGDVWALLTDADPGEEAILTSIQFGIGSFNAGGSVFVNQLETSFYRKGMITTFGGDPGGSTVICVPSNFDLQCEAVEATIQEALDTPGLGAEDIILVDSGTYGETLTISSPVMLLGANAGVSGCDRSAPESLIEGTVFVDAPEVLIDGFSISNPLANPNLTVSADGDRVTLANNRFLSSDGLHVTFFGGATAIDGATIADCEFQGTLVPPTVTATEPKSPSIVAQLLFQNDMPGAYVVRNCFVDAPVTAVAIENSSTLSDSGTRAAVINDNLFDGTAGGVNSQFGTFDGVTIEGNLFTGLQGPGVAGRLINSLVLDNIFQGGVADGVQLSQSGVGSSSGSSVLLNCFFENAGDGVEFSVNGSEDSNSARFNDFAGNGAGAAYAGAETIDVTSNYWNAADGPSGDGPGSGDAADGAGLDFKPFLPTPLTVSTPCNPDADLTVLKVDDVPYAQAIIGDPVTYTITVGNLGPFDATGVQVEDTPPEGLDLCTWTCTSSGSASCDATNGADEIIETLDVPVGDTVTYEMTCTFNPGPGTAGKLVNVVTVTPGGEVDYTTDNNTDSEGTEIEDIFEDGFESGDTSAWSSTVN